MPRKEPKDARPRETTQETQTCRAQNKAWRRNGAQSWTNGKWRNDAKLDDWRSRARRFAAATAPPPQRQRRRTRHRRRTRQRRREGQRRRDEASQRREGKRVRGEVLRGGNRHTRRASCEEGYGGSRRRRAGARREREGAAARGRETTMLTNGQWTRGKAAATRQRREGTPPRT